MEVDPKAVRNGVTLADAIAKIETGDVDEGLQMLKQWQANEPLPCPCCGGAPFIGIRGVTFLVVCENCGLSTQSGELEDVVRVWNRRCDANKTE